MKRAYAAIVLGLAFFVLTFVWGFTIGFGAATFSRPAEVFCPQEDSCYVDYEGGEWTVYEGEAPWSGFRPCGDDVLDVATWPAKCVTVDGGVYEPRTWTSEPTPEVGR